MGVRLTPLGELHGKSGDWANRLLMVNRYRRAACPVAICSLSLAVVLVAACQSNPGGGGRTEHGSQKTGSAQVRRLLTERAAHSATSLDSRTILLAGGCHVDGCTTATRTTELYRSGRLSYGPRLTVARDSQAAVALGDGLVLLVGGYRGEGQPPLRSAEICSTARCRRVGGLRAGSGDPEAARTGRQVLVVGGADRDFEPSDATDLFDPSRRLWQAMPPMHDPRTGHSATSLETGDVLVAGGFDGHGRALASAEVFDHDTHRWISVQPLAEARGKHAAVRLSDGRVLIAGGASDQETRRRLASTEIYDPSTQTFSLGPPLPGGRYKLRGGAVALRGDRVLIGSDGPPLIVDVGHDTTTQLRRVGSQPLVFSTTSLLTRDRVLLAGGYDAQIRVSDQLIELPLP